MPIKRIEKTAPQLPRIGQLWKGGPKKPGKTKEGKDYLGYGDDLKDCFRFTSDDPLLEEKFAKVFKTDRPRAIPFRFYYASSAENFDYWQEEWASGGGLMHRCDGETCVLWWDAKQKLYRQDPKPCPGGCEAVGRLKMFIDELGRWGLVSLTTHSFYDVLNLQRNFKSLQEDFGNLRGMRVVLRRVEDEVHYLDPKDGERKKARKWLLLLELAPELAEYQLAKLEQRYQAMLERPQPPLELPAGTVVIEGDDEGDDASDGVPDGVDAVTGEYTPPAEAEATTPPPPPTKPAKPNGGKSQAWVSLYAFLESKFTEAHVRAEAVTLYGRDVDSLSVQELQKLRDKMLKAEQSEAKEGLFKREEANAMARGA